MANDQKKSPFFQLPTAEELEKFLAKRLRGQPKAVRAVVEQYGYFHSGLKELEESDRHRPIGTFIMAGPSRVGKTELGRVLAECFYGTRSALTKLDMNNFTERHSVARLIGSPPGYIGHGDPCEFSDQRLYAKIPGFEKRITHKDPHKSIPENTPSPPSLASLQYQLLSATLRKRGYELLLQELAVIEKALLHTKGTLLELAQEEKNKGPSKKRTTDREHSELRQRMLQARYSKLLLLYINQVQDELLSQSQKKTEQSEPREKIPTASPSDQISLAEDPTEATPVKPILIIILDEIEKAHPEVFDFLMNIFEDGRITLGDGSETYFDNALFFLTTNAGAEAISAALKKKSKKLGFHPPHSAQDFDETVKTTLGTIFKPEFLNRIDRIITFKDLSEQDLRDILDLHLEEFSLGLRKRNYFLTVEPAAKDLIVKRALTRPEAQSKALLDELRMQVKLPLAQKINAHEIKPGDSVIVGLASSDETPEQIVFSIQKKPAP